MNFLKDKPTDTIEPEDLREALEHLASKGLTGSHHRSKGQSWLARQIGVSVGAVAKWLNGSRPLRGASAVAVRAVIKEATAQ